MLMKNKHFWLIIIILAAFFFPVYLSYLQRDVNDTQERPPIKDQSKVLVVTSLFPWYDLVKEIGAERVEPVLLLSPGLDAHSFEPIPQDILRISQSDLFLYTNNLMEPWARNLTRSLNDSKRIIALVGDPSLFESDNVPDNEGNGNNNGDQDEDFHDDFHDDPHVWLDPLIMEDLAFKVKELLSSVDPGGRLVYQANYERYLASLELLDKDYRLTLSNCQNRDFIFAGHSAFSYLAKRYDLSYESASGFSPNAESSPKRLMVLNNKLEEKNLQYLFTDILENQQLAQSLSKSAKVEILNLKTGANLSKADFNANLSYIDIMRYNLEQLSKGLICQE